jgi:hypothetical protein
MRKRNCWRRRGIPLLAVLLTGCGAAAGVAPSLPAHTSSSPITSSPTVAATLNPTSRNPPPPRYGPAVGFDPISNRLLLFGGSPQPLGGHPTDRLADTWAWDGQVWTQLSPAHSPTSLYGARLVLDPVSGRLLLVSGAGQTDASGAVRQQGMWSWDGGDWARAADNPLQIPFPVVASDPVHRTVVLAGFDSGYPSGGPSSPDLTKIDVPGADVWDGATWKDAVGSTPSDQLPYTSESGTAYDPISHRVISCGGFGEGTLQATYAWDGTRWSVAGMPAAGGGYPDPSWPGSTASAATDPATASILMVAASAQNSAIVPPITWRFDGENWRPISGAAAPALVDWSVVADPVVGGLILVGLAKGGTSEAVYHWTGTSWRAIPSG